MCVNSSVRRSYSVTRVPCLGRVDLTVPNDGEGAWSWFYSNFHPDDPLDSSYDDPSHTPIYGTAQLNDTERAVSPPSKYYRNVPYRVTAHGVYSARVVNAIQTYLDRQQKLNVAHWDWEVAFCRTVSLTVLSQEMLLSYSSRHFRKVRYGYTCSLFTVSV